MVSISCPHCDRNPLSLYHYEKCIKGKVKSMYQSHDFEGREYLKADEAKAGMKVELDGGFECCALGETEIKADDEGNLYFECSEGKHYLDGQCDNGTHYIGVFKV